MAQFGLTTKDVSHVKGELARMFHNRNLGKTDGGKGAKGDKGGKSGKGKGNKAKGEKVMDSEGKQVVCRFFPEGDCKYGNECPYKHEQS